MKKLFKILPILLLPLCLFMSSCVSEADKDSYKIRFTFTCEGLHINIGYAIIGDFCNWGNVNDELSDDAVVLEFIDEGLYKGEKTFDKPTTINYKLVQYGDSILDNRIIEIEDVPNRTITVDSNDVSVSLRWGELD